VLDGPQQLRAGESADDADDPGVGRVEGQPRSLQLTAQQPQAAPPQL